MDGYTRAVSGQQLSKHVSMAIDTLATGEWYFLHAEMYKPETMLGLMSVLYRSL
jgi:hypothetical protein